MLTPNLRPLPEPDRTLRLNRYLTALNQEPSLSYFRALVEAPADRQLALIAALERAIQTGAPAVVPPKLDDQADLLLCDILDVLDRPEFANHGAAYGPDRHLATLQVLGFWRGREPLSKPTAHELFTTAIAALTANQHNHLLSLNVNSSPRCQGPAQNGELIVASPPSSNHTAAPAPALQVAVIPELVESESIACPSGLPASSTRINHHDTSQPGEQTQGDEIVPETIPARPIRRGRPLLLDDLAKGRLLGLIAYGLSFRQAAAQLGIHHVTILNLMKRDEQFAQQVAEARLDALSQPLITIVRASRTNWRAAAWLAQFLHRRHAHQPESTPEERALLHHEKAAP